MQRRSSRSGKRETAREGSHIPSTTLETPEDLPRESGWTALVTSGDRSRHVDTSTSRHISTHLDTSRHIVIQGLRQHLECVSLVCFSCVCVIQRQHLKCVSLVCFSRVCVCVSASLLVHIDLLGLICHKSSLLLYLLSRQQLPLPFHFFASGSVFYLFARFISFHDVCGLFRKQENNVARCGKWQQHSATEGGMSHTTLLKPRAWDWTLESLGKLASKMFQDRSR